MARGLKDSTTPFVALRGPPSCQARRFATPAPGARHGEAARGAVSGLRATQPLRGNRRIEESTRDSACSPRSHGHGRTAHPPGSLPSHHPTTPRGPAEACACARSRIPPSARTRPAACDPPALTSRRARMWSGAAATAEAACERRDETTVPARARAVMCRAARHARARRARPGRGPVRSLASCRCHVVVADAWVHRSLQNSRSGIGLSYEQKPMLLARWERIKIVQV